MKLVTKIILLLITSTMFSQNNFWQSKDVNNIPEEDVINYETEVSRFSVFELDESSLINALQNTPYRFSQNTSNVLLQIPYSENNFGIFEMFEVQTLAPALAAKYPNIKSYVGKNRSSNTDRLRLTITPHGVYAKVFSVKGSILINPMSKIGSFYKVFNSNDAIFAKYDCDFEAMLENEVLSTPSSDNAEMVVDDSTFRTYRMAGAANGEYSTFHINQAGVSNGTTAQKKAAVLAAMTVSLDRVNGILENELSVNIQFISNTDSFIFLDPATDPYSNPNSTGAILNDNVIYMPGAVGNANFDIGHVFTTAPGGVAFRGSVCNNNLKAGGVTGTSNPVGEGFDLILAHEIGHQLGAAHSYNNPCSGNRSDNSVYEVGSGVTIMSYAGICSPNVQSNRFDHYHPASLLQMFNVISNTSCAQTTSISNNPPNITPDSNYTIPKRTPFVLDAQATDQDNDNLSYNWEQFDNELGTQPPVASSASGPLFRGFRLTSDTKRFFPRMQTILNNQNQTTWEVLPNVARSMDFLVTVRDNNIQGGQSDQDLVTVNVANVGPFEVTSQNTTGIMWTPGTSETITWNVAGTDSNGIDASEVDIMLSTNGGISFDHILLQNTPNDGSESINVPFGIVGNQSRIMVKASDNIFFAVNEEFFNVNAVCENESNTSTINIPDGMGFIGPMPGTPGESVINISQNDVISSLSVDLDLSHDRLNDIDIELESPDGQIVQLWSRDLCNPDGLDLKFLDGGTTLPLSNCSGTLSGVFSPFEPLSAFDDGNTNGNWTLRVTDFFLGNVGTINSWSIEICSAEFLNSETFTQDLFSLFPNPANNNITLQFSQSNLMTKTEIYDLSGRLVKSIEFNSSAQSETLNISDLNRGIYLVKVNQNNQQTVKKLIVK